MASVPQRPFKGRGGRSGSWTSPEVLPFRSDNGLVFTSRSYAEKNADILRIAVEEVGAIEKWAGSQRSDAATEYAAVLGLDRGVVEVAVNRTPYGTVAITKTILAEQQQIADTFWELKLLPKKISILEAAQAGVA